MCDLCWFHTELILRLIEAMSEFRWSLYEQGLDPSGPEVNNLDEITDVALRCCNMHPEDDE